MGTRSTIKHEHDEATGVGVQVFTDWLDECAGFDVVGLRLNGMPFTAVASEGGLSVEVKMPREMAERLGLMPSTPG